MFSMPGRQRSQWWQRRRGSLFVTHTGGMPRFLDGAGADSGLDAPGRGRDDDAPGGDGAGPGRRTRSGAAVGPAALRWRLGPPSRLAPAITLFIASTATESRAKCLRVKALVHALVWADNRLLVGTGPEGQLYEVPRPR